MKAGPITPIVEELQASPATGVSITRVPHRGWSDSFLLTNGSVEAIVVPAIGRLMQFRMVGDPAGTFWENQELDGQVDRTAKGEWLNFGGDKCWPAPQSGWANQQGHSWPPPFAFDAGPAQAMAAGSALVLTSPIDSAWGIEVVRRIELDGNQPVLRIETEYRKVQGAPVKVAIWTITQMQEPERVFMVLDPKSKFDDGYVRLFNAEPADLEMHAMQKEDRLLSFRRHRGAYIKIGADSARLAWIGSTCAVRIEVEPMRGEYPDGGCITEVYTNPDPLHYVELETLGPVTELCTGESIGKTARYTVARRSSSDPLVEAQRLFRDLSD